MPRLATSQAKRKAAPSATSQNGNRRKGLTVEHWPLARFVPYPRNPRKNDDAVDRMAGSIREFGFKVPMLAKSDGTIVDGHLRLKAAHKLGLTELPVILCDEWTDAQVRAFRLMVNRSVAWAEWDDELLALEFADLGDFDLTLTGFDAGEIERLISGAGGSKDVGLDEAYSRKIVVPVYEPKGECPGVGDLFDRDKTAQLIEEIDAADLPREVARFLRLAAERHTAFHFRRIAEFYCHADAKVQDLMEKSGLVIIDFKKAIEYGFVHLTERLGALADLEESESYDGNA